MLAQKYAQQILRAGGWPVTPENVSFIQHWQQFEGGGNHNSANFNPLNTTHGPGRAINSVGVKSFANARQGALATAQTLNNGRYPNLVAGLASGNPYQTPGVSGDLQTWVSGSRTGNPGYAQKVLGGPGIQGGAAPAGAKVQAPTSNSVDLRQAFASYLMQNVAAARMGQPPDMSGLMGLAMARYQQQQAQQRIGPGPQVGHIKGNGFMQLPTQWGGTHVTDGLGWGTKTAEDIMGHPGTQLGAPVGGTIKYFHPTGAQGGGSMELIGDDGRTYWLGHIANGLPGGTKVKAGQVIATISGDHPRPHVHIDVR